MDSHGTRNLTQRSQPQDLLSTMYTKLSEFHTKNH